MHAQAPHSPCSVFLCKEQGPWDWVATSSDATILFDQIATLPHAKDLGVISFMPDKDRLADPRQDGLDIASAQGWSLWWHDGQAWRCGASGSATMLAMADDLADVLQRSPQEVRILPPDTKGPRTLH